MLRWHKLVLARPSSDSLSALSCAGPLPCMAHRWVGLCCHLISDASGWNLICSIALGHGADLR